jgi:outer membrane protein assembly factor BamB
MVTKLVLVGLFTFVWIAAEIPVMAGDWPQILGPQRNGVAEEILPAKALHAAPRLAWKAKIGEGYAGAAVVGEQVLVFHRLQDVEQLLCLHATHGSTLWKADFPANYRGGIDPDTGPRCVPVVAASRVFLLGASGSCHAVDLKSGETLWTRNLAEDFNAPDGYFGAGSTPVVVHETLLVNVGGKKGGIVGLHVSDGKTAFALGNEQASYASPISYATQAADKSTQALFVTRLNFVAVNPQLQTQKILTPFGRSGPTVNAAIPLLHEDKVFLTASYGVGGALIDLKHPQEPLWSNDESLSSQYSTPVLHHGFLYGVHGREDIPPAHLRCVEWNTGKVLWSRDGFGVAHVIRIANELLLTTIEGECVIVACDSEGYRELARHRLTTATTRALPAFSNGQLFVRSNQGKQGELLCYSWSKK